MTAAQLEDMQHGRYVVVDLLLAPEYHALTITSSGSTNVHVGVIRHSTAGAAAQFIERAPEGVVLGRYTTESAARARVGEVMRAARQEFLATNRFLEVWVAKDGTVKYRQPLHSGSDHEWRAVTADDDGAFANAVYGAVAKMLANLGASLNS